MRTGNVSDTSRRNVPLSGGVRSDLEEGQGGGAGQAAILDPILIGQILEPFHRQLSGLRAL